MEEGFSNERFRAKRGRPGSGLLLTKQYPWLLPVILAVGCALVAGGIGLFGMAGGVLMLLAIIGIPVLYTTVAYPATGIQIMLVIAYLLLFAEKFTEFPVGVLMDALLALLIIGFLLQQKKDPDWTIFRNPISIMTLIWIVYNILEVANPTAASKMAWLYTVRTVALVLLTHFVFLRQLQRVSQVRTLFIILICLGCMAALYGLKQEYVGFFSFEQQWLDKNPTAISLYFIDGRWRKFSLFSDPVTFSYNMVICALLCLALITGPVKFYKKIILGLIGFTCLYAMLFSGTRGAYVLFPVAVILLMILKFNKAVLFFGSIACVLFAALIFMPTSNKTIQRFQSAFSPENDASFNVRKLNQKKIQPFIQTHPIGGGLGSTGTWGQRFSPDNFLASFPPDSGYVRVAVENGWIGLLLFCTMMFVILKVGISNYYAIRDKRLKSYCLAMVLVLFALHIGNYPQEALVQYPTNIIFSLAFTLLLTLRRLDQQLSGNSLKQIPNGK